MRAPVSIAPLALLACLACGAKTDLEVAARRSDAAPGPCAPATPTLFSAVRLFPRAVEGARVWGPIEGPEQGVAYLDAAGREHVVATGQLAVRAMVAEGGIAWWSTPGLADGDGAIMRATRSGDVRRLVPGLTQPGALDLHGEWITFGNWTNLPGPGDDGRGSLRRVSRDGDALEELLDGLGMPTATAHLEGELFWLDRRRAQIATLPPGTLTPRVVAGIDSVRRPMIAWNGALYVAAPRERGEALIRVERAMPPEPAAVATLDREIRTLVGVDAPVTRGVGIAAFDGRGRVLYYRLRDHAVLDLGPGGSPAADTTHLYWSTDEGVMRVCLDYLESL